ncbi:hypothetical protein SAMN05444166_6320 [Singulisphaera sp. GP187]|uniref:hypothetical protein n=1 Tax=Singulisphaera sp. GP187 TaxID=1882752 RepID=UPI0009299F28|nr:hypothetical protein [Singulisphaera sp. GP187]SIO60238.1 hypothetical protein SAMN05444166_6320 [Singulisphaera sp. GP187]
MARRNRRVGVGSVRTVGLVVALLSGSSGFGQGVNIHPELSSSGPLAPARPELAGVGVPLASPQSERIEPGTGWNGISNSLSNTAVPITSIDQLLRMDRGALDVLYQSSGAAPMPVGKVKGRVILYPGTGLTRPASKVARLMWQGKIFKNEQPMAVNRFFGLKVIKANVYQDQSWLDGRPSLILDYSQTSRLYAPYRDEIREVGPGIFLGLMYSRTQPDPTLKMYFALEATR